MPRFADAALPRRPLRLATATAAAIGITALIVAVLFAIAVAARTQTAGQAASVDVWFVLRISVVQAGLSTVLSLLVGVALAWALNRLTFPGRGLLIGLFSSAIVTPGIIVAFGLLTVWGRSGWISDLSTALTGEPLRLPIFGMGGIVAAHVILDGALAARILQARLDTIPLSRLRTGQSLGLSAARRFAVLDWPAMRSSLPGLAAIIFLLAFTSFPIVLLMGGGPANQTLEVAIYSAVRLDFDLGAAVTLALVQIGLCGAIILTAASFPPVPSSFGTAAPSLWRDSVSARVVQWAVLLVAVFGFGLPLLSVLASGIGPDTIATLSEPALWAAAVSSLAIASPSAFLTFVVALGLAMGRASTRSPLARVGLSTPAFAYLAVPAVALSLGFFLLVRALGIAPGLAAPVVVVVANALLALPFALATLGPPLETLVRRHGRVIRSLGLTGWRQFAAVEWPLLGRDVGLVLALSFCFSLGDLGVIALFGTQDFATLPLYMFRALGSYRTHEAATVAALMLVITVAAFAVLPPVIGRLTHARP